MFTGRHRGRRLAPRIARSASNSGNETRGTLTEKKTDGVGLCNKYIVEQLNSECIVAFNYETRVDSVGGPERYDEIILRETGGRLIYDCPWEHFATLLKSVHNFAHFSRSSEGRENRVIVEKRFQLNCGGSMESASVKEGSRTIEITDAFAIEPDKLWREIRDTKRG
ncbi:uncharacterized protein LOC143151415 [Ptiloglossa arizonensis]|uniref:uncharacterized protein LOC143151415 n=1 Tax=Ptiloglossa arizonensis TaxID=3350558 RepID=UPI003FA0294C